jgi:hypothetical protein
MHDIQYLTGDSLCLMNVKPNLQHKTKVPSRVQPNKIEAGTQDLCFTISSSFIKFHLRPSHQLQQMVTTLNERKRQDKEQSSAASTL